MTDRPIDDLRPGRNPVNPSWVILDALADETFVSRDHVRILVEISEFGQPITPTVDALEVEYLIRVGYVQSGDGSGPAYILAYPPKGAPNAS